VAAVLEAERVPRSPAYRRRARRLADPLAAALSGGEDYELLLAVAPGDLAAARAASRTARTPLALLGRFEEGAGVRVLAAGRPRTVPSGHDHLRLPAPPSPAPPGPRL